MRLPDEVCAIGTSDVRAYFRNPFTGIRVSLSYCIKILMLKVVIGCVCRKLIVEQDGFIEKLMV